LGVQKRVLTITRSGLEKLRSAWTFDVARIRLSVTQVRAQHRVKTKLHDKQVLR